MHYKARKRKEGDGFDDRTRVDVRETINTHARMSRMAVGLLRGHEVPQNRLVISDN